MAMSDALMADTMQAARASLESVRPYTATTGADIAPVITPGSAQVRIPVGPVGAPASMAEHHLGSGGCPRYKRFRFCLRIQRSLHARGIN